MIGKTISHYKIVEKLGEGGMGEVYLAQDIKLDRKVAIKFIPEHLTKIKENVERFEREAKAAAALNHPNIVTIHDIIETENQKCIVMEYIAGDSLRDKIEKGLSDLNEISNILKQICEGLAKAHQANIVHRDIKPENILIDRDGRVKLLDFGLAKLTGVSKLTKEISTLGTLHYMAPEQIQGKEVDHRSDIWSLGIVLYELLMGEPPFKGEYDAAVLYAILNEEPGPIDDNVPVALKNIIQKSLSKNPFDRYQDMGELISELIGIDNESLLKSSVKVAAGQRLMFTFTLLFLIVVVFISLGFLLKPLIMREISVNNKTEWDNSIAVLPFADLSPNKDQEFFCLGLTDQIITNLSKLRRLKVIGRTSVMKFRDSERTLTEIGKELDVDHILEGSIRRSGSQMRINTQLVRAVDGSHIWAEQYDQEVSDIFYVQDEVSGAIAFSLLETLSQHDKEVVKSIRSKNIEAFELYLKGRYYFLYHFRNDNSIKTFKTAEELLKKSIQLDPEFVDSYAELSMLYGHYVYLFPDDSLSKKFLKLQEKYISEADNLGKNNAKVQDAKGTLHFVQGRFDEAYDDWGLMFKLAPNSPYSNISIGNFYAHRGILHLGVKYLSRAIELEPLLGSSYGDRAYFKLYSGQETGVERDFLKAIELDPNDFYSQKGYVYFLLTLNRIADAKQYLKKFSKNNPVSFISMPVIYAMDNNREQAIQSLKYITSKRSRHSVSSYVYAILRMTDEAIRNLDEYLLKYNTWNRSYYLFLKNCPYYDNIRNDQKFKKILKREKKIYEENLKKYIDIDTYALSKM